jgi:hypothetical protein
VGLALVVLLASTALAGVAAAGSMASAHRGVDALATILARETVHGRRMATVQFTTASGVRIDTRIAICHHQSYAVGRTVPVRYTAAQPTRAWERAMPPRPNLAFPAGTILVGWLLFLAVLAGTRLSRRGPTTATPAEDAASVS